MVTKICKCCGKQFTTTKNSQQYCNVKCRQKQNYIDNKQTEFTCAFCGQTFTSQWKKKYCCRECLLKANKRIKGISSKRKKPTKSSSEIEELARAEGLTYGKYVAKYGL